jgi:hypothetical protein
MGIKTHLSLLLYRQGPSKVDNTKKPPKAYPHKHAVSSIAFNFIVWQSH